MSEPETLPQYVHPEVALLPWYANGTLAEVERQQVARHLETCEDCRAELEELSALKASLTAIYDAQPGPSAQTARSVLAAVSRELHAGGSSLSKRGPGLERIDQWLRSLFLPQWVPTLAAVLLVVQMGLLVWVTLPPVEHREISTRSLGMQAPKIVVVFQPSATEEQIRSLLQRLHAKVVDGPTADGAFTITLATDEPTAAATLAQLHEQRDVIRSAELVHP